MAAPSSSRETADKRLPNTFVACPIVYGSIAFYLGKKAQEYQTHSWTLYVRGPQDEDLSAFVSKVAFTLHPSFAQPVREVTKAPFQITETGWGEFEAGIRIYFKDSNEQPVDLFHHLRLYPPNPAHQLNPKKPVVSENYDEIVFCNPFTKFHSMLMQYGGSSKSAAAAAAAAAAASSSSNATSGAPPLPPNPNATTTAWPEHYIMFDDAMDMEMLLSIHQHIQRELLETKRRLVDCETQVVDAQQGYSAPVPGTSSSTKASSTKTKQSGQQKQGQKKDANASALPGDIEVKMEPTGQQAKTASADATKDEGNNIAVDTSSAMDVDEPAMTAALQIAVPS